jgi:hypothetical protein
MQAQVTIEELGCEEQPIKKSISFLNFENNEVTIIKITSGDTTKLNAVFLKLKGAFRVVSWSRVKYNRESNTYFQYVNVLNE